MLNFGFFLKRWYDLVFLKSLDGWNGVSFEIWWSSILGLFWTPLIYISVVMSILCSTLFDRCGKLVFF
jgi:hypothetical protein